MPPFYLETQSTTTMVRTTITEAFGDSSVQLLEQSHPPGITAVTTRYFKKGDITESRWPVPDLTTSVSSGP